MESIDNIPEEFICPITLEIMEDPVLCEDGHTYERKAIQQLRTSISPLTRQPIDKTKLIPNRALKECIQRFIEPLNKEIREKKITMRKRLEKERIEKDKLEKERLEKIRLEKERLDKEMKEIREKLEKERLEIARLEKERLDEEQREKDKQERERLERYRLEKERLEKERRERERIEKERLEKEKIERERLEKEQLKKIEEYKELKIKQLIEKSNIEYEQRKKESKNKNRLDNEINDNHIMTIQNISLNIRDNKIKYSYYINKSYMELIKVFGSSSKNYIEDNIFNQLFDFIDNNNKDTIYIIYTSLKELCIEFNTEKTKIILGTMSIDSNFIDIFDISINLIIIKEIIKLINHIVKIF